MHQRTLNKGTADVKAIAQARGPEMMERLAKLCCDEKHPAHFQAIKEWLDRAYGRPAQAIHADFGGANLVINIGFAVGEIAQAEPAVIELAVSASTALAWTNMLTCRQTSMPSSGRH